MAKKTRVKKNNQSLKSMMMEYQMYKVWFKKEAGVFFKILYYIGVTRLYANVKHIDARFRWWHPLSWAVYVLMIPICLINKSTVITVFADMFMVNPYYRKNKDKIYWFNPHSKRRWKGK